MEEMPPLPPIPQFINKDITNNELRKMTEIVIKH